MAILLAGSAPAPDLPAIVFVSRNPVPGEPRAIPGLGPHLRAIQTGGRLLVREKDGRVREVVPPGRFFDVSDPSVSPDARRVAFAAVTTRDSSWRLWVVALDGSGLIAVTGEDGAPAAAPARFDDLDPCWLDDSTLVFASTRFPQRAQYADLPVTNLYTVGVDCAPDRFCNARRIT